MLLRVLKSGFRAAFFFFFLSSSSTAAVAVEAMMPSRLPHAAASVHQSRIIKWADHPVWHALLHLDQGVPTLRDPQFLLANADFSPQAEMALTLAALYGPNSQEVVCRFPARYAWLQAQFGLPEIPMRQCQELQEFLIKAPGERISLVFASENLAQPSSMLGHLILKVDGLDAGGVHREHAISFFTDTATLNLPKLLFDSLLIGKQGYFALSPYESEVTQYVHKEQRTLWEYELLLSEPQRTLIRYHLMELKGSNFVYFFHRHNCATLLKHIVAVAWPDMLKTSSWIDTPKSVIKLASRAAAISAARVNAPPRWHVRAIDALLPSDISLKVRDDVQAKRLDFANMEGLPPHQTYLSLELAGAYHQYLSEQNSALGEAAWSDYQSQLHRLKAAVQTDYVLEVSPQREPVRAPGESQMSLGWRSQRGHQRLTVNVLPVSHTVADDNQYYSGESELRLFDTALTLDPDSGRVGIQRFTVYAAKSLLPYDKFTGGWSGQFKLGWEAQPGRDLEDRTALLIEAGIGKTSRVLPDVDVYGLVNVGVGMRTRGYGYVQPEMGVIIREIYDMKSRITVSYLDRPLGREDGVMALSFTQSKYLNGGISLMFDGTRRFADRGRRSDTVSLSVKQVF